MANVVTIDNYDVKVHERWATDQEALDTQFIDDTDFIPRNSEISGMSITYMSKWEELFQCNEHRHPWAAFVPPPLYTKMRPRYFSYAISQNFDWADSDEEDDQEEREREEQRHIQQYKKKILSKKSNLMPLALFERDRGHLLKLFDAIQMVNGCLREIHGRKLQYQKG